MSWSASTEKKDWSQKFTIDHWWKFEPRYFVNLTFYDAAFSEMNFAGPIMHDCGSGFMVLIIYGPSESIKTGKVCNRLRFYFWNFSSTHLLAHWNFEISTIPEQNMSVTSLSY